MPRLSQELKSLELKLINDLDLALKEQSTAYAAHAKARSGQCEETYKATTIALELSVYETNYIHDLLTSVRCIGDVNRSLDKTKKS